MGCLSFHETKNIISGEGGALLLNRPDLVQRAEVIREKGTNRSQFFRGQVDKYTWCDLGSSFLPSDLLSAFLWAQMEAADEITHQRIELWQRYHNAFEVFENSDLIRRPVLPENCQHNAHMYYLLLPDLEKRTRFIHEMKARGVGAVFHYVPLHSAPAGLSYGRAHGTMAYTNEMSDRLVRLPLWIGLNKDIDYVIDKVNESLH